MFFQDSRLAKLAHDAWLRLYPTVKPSTNSTPVELNGRQWCEGSTSLIQKNHRVALVFTGQAFRAKDFFTHTKLDCSNASVPVQKSLAENHLGRLIRPLEARGMRVDIFLSVTPCSAELQKGRLQAPEDDFDNAQALTELYGRKRVKGLFRFDRSVDMYTKMADSFVRLDRGISANGTYEYFLFLRYDIFLDQSFASLIPPGFQEHKGLSFFFRVHDFLFGFPGEMWNCMKTFWDRCLRVTSNKGIQEVGWEERTRLGCFNVGPLQLDNWTQGYAYGLVLRRIVQGVHGAGWRGSAPGGAPPPWEPWTKTGTSAFDQQGNELRCNTGWYWPPKSRWEHRYMPYYYHVGPG